MLSRLDWSFIFAGFYFMVALFYHLNRYDLLFGWVSMYLIAMGHLSLNGLSDRVTDSLNPRKLSLQNPFAEDKNGESAILTPKIVYIWVSCLWLFALVLNILFMPYNNLAKIFLAFIFFSVSIFFSIIYSMPPIRLKARPFIDLISTFFIFGFLYPIYAVFVTIRVDNIFEPHSYISLDIIIVGIIFNVLLLTGIHMPTVLGDMESDKAAGDRTTAVYLGWDKASKLTVIASLERTIGLTLIVTWLVVNQYLLLSVFTIIPYLLCIPDLYFDYRLWISRDRIGAVNLWKSIIFTSIAGGFSIGYLYFTKNPQYLNQYFIPLMRIIVNS